MLPFLDNPDQKSLHTLWNRKIYCFLRDFFDSVAMGPPTEFDELGNPEIVKQEGTGFGWVFPYSEGGESAYDGEFALSVDVTGEQPRLIVSGGTLNVQGTPVAVPQKVFTTIPSAVYLVVRGSWTGQYAVSLDSSNSNALAYILIGTTSTDEDGSVTVHQKYLGGTGLYVGYAFVLPNGSRQHQVLSWSPDLNAWIPGNSLPPGGMTGQILRWNGTRGDWEAGWLTATPND